MTREIEREIGNGVASATESDRDEATRPMDPAVLGVLVDNRRAFVAFLERRVGRRDVAEDILQEAFAKGATKLESLRDEEAVVACFYRTLRNATVDYFRRAKTRDAALARFAEEVETSETPPEAMAEEVCRCVSRLAGTLKPEYAAALKRIEVDGISVATFADETGISRSNAAVRVFRARDALRRRVADSCGACATHGCTSCTCPD